ncbi:hypothetical protein KBK19_16805 [Microvirga sp. STR05]|uniref:Restriction endonuclease n=1 Tax=Hymenobacter duratus TaxID=2771356 RepID=A0ABR8JIM0_9BACT|nr:hypothetical protein [Hymenobacter duratus]MBD2716707.1 hypothetical protein [Hymenobacter duratus]MBR7951622.1 hypothetical protein [Microvirga sp. STR05]
MKNYNGRLTELRRKLNYHLTKLTGVDKDFYAALTQDDLLELKSAVADINNVLTFKATIAAAQWLGTHFQLNETAIQEVMDTVDGAKPNSNGFDIHINTPAIVAEVKSIVPVSNGMKFGQNQSDSIINDIRKLIIGKKSVPGTDAYIKILFILDLVERTDNAIKKLMESRNFKVSVAALGKEVCLLEDTAPVALDVNKVYIKRVRI